MIEKAVREGETKHAVQAREVGDLEDANLVFVCGNVMVNGVVIVSTNYYVSIVISTKMGYVNELNLHINVCLNFVSDYRNVSKHCLLVSVMVDLSG